MKRYESIQCLNGWWDYAPAGNETRKSSIPKDGWMAKAYLVPSLVTKSLAGVRKKGSMYYTEHLNESPIPFADGEHAFLFDNHDYPVEWMRSDAGWARRKLRLDPLPTGKRRFLRLDAVAGRSEVWLDGQRISAHNDAFLPNEIDVSEQLDGGEHEIAVLIRDYERLPADPKKTLTPSGNMMSAHMRGIWQDVWLIERGEVYISDTTIQTSVRDKTLTLITKIANAADRQAKVEVGFEITNWVKQEDDESPAEDLEPNTPPPGLPPVTLTIPPHSTATHTITVPWKDAVLWQPEQPHLYLLSSAVRKNGHTIDSVTERFGFREVWIEGPDFFLNGYPVHFFSDWGHKVNQLHHTKEWNRCWFDMMRKENMNHSRLHTHPHPEMILDLADEEGIFITGETAIHGSGGEQAADEDAYWEAAREHVARFIRRDKNHPSLLLWSVENEMRWNQDKSDKTKQELPKLYRLFRDLDPTREAYHEGDSSLWNEGEQAIMSRHYGKECGGYGWWDKQRPLHAGEMSAYHYMGPNTNFHTGGGDELWADYTKVVEAAARETQWIIEAGRTQGTAAFGPWNISCLCNLRMHKEKVTLEYDDWTTPGVKPQYIQPHSAEFEFWKDSGDTYTPMGETNAIQARAFRPFALIDLSHRRSYYGGKALERSLYLVNDTFSEQSGTVSLKLLQGRDIFHQESFSLEIGRGRVVNKIIQLDLPEVDKATRLTFIVTFVTDNGKVLDELKQSWTLHPSIPACEIPGDRKVLLIGKGPSEDWLRKTGLPFNHETALDGPVPGSPDLVIMERDTVIPGSRQNQWIKDYLQTGGQVLLLEQTHSLFPGVVLESKAQLHGFLRGYEHPVLNGFHQDDLQFWGEDPYASMDSDAHIAHRVYHKGDDGLLQPVVDTGEGGFGLKLPEWTVLGEVKLGMGRLLASQFRFHDKAGTIPEAGRLFVAMIQYLLGEKALALGTGSVAEADNREDLISALNRAEVGGSAWIRLRDESTLAEVARCLQVELKGVSKMCYHAVRSKDDPILSGISHVDVSGIDGMTYCFHEESKAIAGFALRSHPRMEPLLVTPTKALLEEFHIHGQRTEPIRTHAASRFLFAEAPVESVLLGRIRHGKGWVYLDTFGRPEETHPRLRRYESMFLRNLGGALQENALTGEAVPEGATFSQGFPIQVLATPVRNKDHRADLAANTALPSERMAPTGMFRLGNWQVLDHPDGIWNPESAREVALFTCLHSPRPRRITMEDSGIPNPESLTFLDVEATGGSVELFLNGSSKGTQSLTTGRSTFSDLELTQGFNQILLLWKNVPDDSRLHFRFRNIMQQPETDLRFLVSNAGASDWIDAEL